MGEEVQPGYLLGCLSAVSLREPEGEARSYSLLLPLLLLPTSCVSRRERWCSDAIDVPPSPFAAAMQASFTLSTAE